MSSDKTKWIFDDAPAGGSDNTSIDELTETLDNTHGAFQGRTMVGDEPTVQLTEGSMPASDKTQIYTRANAEKFEAPSGFSDGIDPVTGWLVVVKGPGLGASITVGTGMNIVGRGNDVRCSLPFGDTLISSDDHVRIIYDEDERKFFIGHGSGKNVSRVNGQLLMNTMALEDGDVINLSKVTTVMFRAFCTADFDWAELDEKAKEAGSGGANED